MIIISCFFFNTLIKLSWRNYLVNFHFARNNVPINSTGYGCNIYVACYQILYFYMRTYTGKFLFLLFHNHDNEGCKSCHLLINICRRATKQWNKEYFLWYITRKKVVLNSKEICLLDKKKIQPYLCSILSDHLFLNIFLIPDYQKLRL